MLVTGHGDERTTLTARRAVAGDRQRPGHAGRRRLDRVAYWGQYGRPPGDGGAALPGVLGGGVVGCEDGAGVRPAGSRVTLFHRRRGCCRTPSRWLSERVADGPGSGCRRAVGDRTRPGRAG
ncbi:hypothetical protein HBB16_21095 [Pseudonocardia sp. MCCB 268]|nr:hypothetical protein [Pseudonocardia cytotoxica]